MTTIYHPDVTNTTYLDRELFHRAIQNEREEFAPNDPVKKLDSEWSSKAFLIGAKNYESSIDRRAATICSADLKFTDSSIGGGRSINMRPQYTPYADPRRKGLLRNVKPITIASASYSAGQGRLYSSYIDDPVEPVYFQFGTPEFNSISGFFQHYSNRKLISMTTAGKTISGEVGAAIGRITAFIFSAYAFGPVKAGLAYTGGSIYLGLSQPITRYYTLRNQMEMYWSAASMVVNKLLVAERQLDMSSRLSGKVEQPEEVDAEKTGFNSLEDDLEHLSNVMPWVFTRKEGIDLSRVGSEYQRRTNHLYSSIKKALSEVDEGDLTSYSEIMANLNSNEQGGIPDNRPSSPEDYSKVWDIQVTKGRNKYYRLDSIKESIEAAGDAIADIAVGVSKSITDGATSLTDVMYGGYEKPKPGEEKIVRKPDPSPGKDNAAGNVEDVYRAKAEGGMDYMVMRFDGLETQTDSFSNSFGDSATEGMINATAGGARELFFNFSGGNIGDGVIAGALESVVGMASAAATGFGEGMNRVTFGLSKVITDTIFGVNVEIPQHWVESTADLSTMTYKTVLTCVDQHPLSRIKGMYIPLGAFIAGSIPLSVGLNSYVSPLYCSVYQPGRMQMPIAMISELSISRGDGTNMSYDKYGRPLSITVEVTVTNMEKAMSVMIGAPGAMADPTEMSAMMNEQNTMSEYLQAMAAQPLESSIYHTQRIEQLAKNFKSSAGHYFSMDRAGDVLHTFTSEGLTGLALSPFEGLVSDLINADEEIR